MVVVVLVVMATAAWCEFGSGSDQTQNDGHDGFGSEF